MFHYYMVKNGHQHCVTCWKGYVGGKHANLLDALKQAKKLNLGCKYARGSAYIEETKPRLFGLLKKKVIWNVDTAAYHLGVKLSDI